MPPIAATAATAEPEIAPKNAQPTMQMVPYAVIEFLKNNLANETSRFEIPPSRMISPAKMKNGIARSAKLSMPVKVVVAMMLGLTVVKFNR